MECLVLNYNHSSAESVREQFRLENAVGNAQTVLDNPVLNNPNYSFNVFDAQRLYCRSGSYFSVI